jgi:serine/threonine-protein kinase
MLLREARVASEVRHPHLITILESQLAHNPPFLVMPWLEGASLEAYVRLSSLTLPIDTYVGHSSLTSPQDQAGKPDVRQSQAGKPDVQTMLDPPVVLWIARQTAEALAALDGAGWRHGDIKPSNIFLSPQRHVTVLDLGFARHRDERDTARVLSGSGHYLAPEHATAGGRPDIRSDIYSLGVVLYQLLAGHVPLDGATLEELIARHKQTAPLPLRRAAPHVSPGVASLVQRMLAKDPLRRPQSPGELLAELVRLEIESFSERAA